MNWIKQHKFWVIVAGLVLLSLSVSSATGNMGLARWAGQVLTILLLVKGLWWLTHRKKKNSRGG